MNIRWTFEERFQSISAGKILSTNRTSWDKNLTGAKMQLMIQGGYFQSYVPDLIGFTVNSFFSIYICFW